MNSQANLLFGIQWDLTLEFLSVKCEADTSGSEIWGNYYNVSFIIDRGQYNTSWTSSSGWINAKNVMKPENMNYKLTTGAADRNKMMNIYDLAGNVWEWTLESDGPEVIDRGGSGQSGYGHMRPVYYRDLMYTDSYDISTGMRASIY